MRVAVYSLLFFLLSIIAFQYISSLKLGRKLDTVEIMVQHLEKENLLLASSLSNMKKLRDEEEKQLKETRKTLDALRNEEEKVVREVEYVFVERGKDRDSCSLPDDVVSLLNKACEGVRGGPCPSP